MSSLEQSSPSTSRSFPHWVALASLGFALLLFFSNTVPALREKQGLEDVEAQLQDLRQQYELAIQRTRLGSGPAHDYDLQSLLVAIDAQGFTPTELCLAYPPGEDLPDESQARAGN